MLYGYLLLFNIEKDCDNENGFFIFFNDEFELLLVEDVLLNEFWCNKFDEK